MNCYNIQLLINNIEDEIFRFFLIGNLLKAVFKEKRVKICAQAKGYPERKSLLQQNYLSCQGSESIRGLGMSSLQEDGRAPEKGSALHTDFPKMYSHTRDQSPVHN